MLRRAIPNSAQTLPVLGLGTYQSFDHSAGNAAALSDLCQVLGALKAGGATLVDTSPMYGRAEARLGEAAQVAAVADSLFFATKVWTTGREAGLQQIEESFRLLRVPCIDLFQIHNLTDWRTHAPTLEDLRDRGRIRHLGITHYHRGAYPELERVMLTRRFGFLQLNYSLAEREAEARLLPLAQELGMAVIANRPFTQGDLLARMRRRAFPKDMERLGFTGWPQVLLAWVMLQEAVTCVIPATGDPTHLADNLAAARAAASLDPGQRESLRAAYEAAL